LPPQSDKKHPKQTIYQKYGNLQSSTSQTSSARTADQKPDLKAPPEVYVEKAFKATMDLNAEVKCPLLWSKNTDFR
jgi:hypothetical protein